VPMSYRIDLEAGLILLKGTGLLTDDEMVQCIAELRRDPELEPGMHTLSDMREIEVGFTAEGVSRMLDTMKISSERRSAARAAIVVSSDVAFGMARMVEGRADGQLEPHFRVFRDIAEAREWLGL